MQVCSTFNFIAITESQKLLQHHLKYHRRVPANSASMTMEALRLLLAIALLFISFVAAQSGPGQFTLTVYRPGSSLHGQVVNAAGSAFYLGGSPVTYCPLTNQTLCPAGNQTILDGMSAMLVGDFHHRDSPKLTNMTQVEVPGGQQVYITSAGALSFTRSLYR
jgi:hypothetical protein